MENFYLSLDEARYELKHRWSNQGLREKIRSNLGDKFIPYFGKEPRGAIFRQMASADNGLNFFYYCSNYIGAKATVIEYLDDLFVSLNEEKKGLGRIRVNTTSENVATVDIINFQQNERKTLRELTTIYGESVTDFHHKLVEIDGLEIDIQDTSDWFKKIGKASDYYFYLFLHFVAHGVLFEYFFDDSGTNEDDFTKLIVNPAFERIESEYGIRPMIVRAYPTNQTKQEDFFWWNHSKIVNDYIINYAKNNNISIINR